jgi:hypothetical protein
MRRGFPGTSVRVGYILEVRELLLRRAKTHREQVRKHLMGITRSATDDVGGREALEQVLIAV